MQLKNNNIHWERTVLRGPITLLILCFIIVVLCLITTRDLRNNIGHIIIMLAGILSFFIFSWRYSRNPEYIGVSEIGIFFKYRTRIKEKSCENLWLNKWS